MLETNTSVIDTSAAPAAPAVSTPTPTPTPSAPTTPAVSTQTATNPAFGGTKTPDSAQNTPVLGQDGQPIPPAFAPDWKYKVKGKEYEIEDWARGIAKDEDTYKKLKRTFERAQGLDEVIESRAQLQKEYEQIQPVMQEHAQVTKKLNELSYYYNNGDLDSFFGTLQIPFETVFNYVKQKHLESQQPPEVQRQLEMSRQAQQKAYTYEQELNELKSRQTTSEKQQSEMFLNHVIETKGQDVATKFNEAQGNPNAFRNYVVFKGQTMSTKERSAPVEEVVEAAVQELAKLMGMQAGQIPTPQLTPSPADVTSSGVKPPVIPNVRAGAQSPVRNPVKTIDDLRKIRDQM